MGHIPDASQPVTHHLKTVNDRLMMMDNGVVTEFVTPWNVIQKDGIFHSMAMKSGTFAEPVRVAKEKAMGDT
jgi:hypothetical protein